MIDLAIIPAKTKSERLKGKNFLDLCGKPLIEWTLDAALDSQMFKEVLVSSRSQQAIDICTSKGITHHWRSESLEMPTATVWEVCKEVIEIKTEGTNKPIESFALLLPTSPLRTEKDIVEAAKIFIHKKPECVMSVTSYEHPPGWALRICGQWLSPNDWGLIKTKRQDLETLYKHDGSIIFVNNEAFLAAEDWFNLEIMPYVMESSVDVNCQADFDYVEYLINKRPVEVKNDYGNIGELIE